MWLLGLAFAASVPHFTANDLAAPQGALLDRWKFYPGDDPRFASPELDDSGARVVSPVLELIELPGWDGVGWFRLHFDVDESARQRRLGLMMSHGGAIEIWLDGERAYVLDGEQDGPALELVPTVRTLDLRKNGPHLLAVRFSNPEWKPMREAGFPAGFHMSLVPLASGVEFANRVRETNLGVHLFFIGVSSALAVLFLLLHVLMQNGRHNLLFALLNLANVSIEISGMLFGRAGSLSSIQWLSVWLSLSVVAISILMMFTMRVLFFERIPRWYRWYAVAGTALVPAMWYLLLPVLYLYSLVSIVEGLRTLGTAIVRRKPGSLIIGAGFVVVGIGIVTQMIGDVRGPEIEESHAASTGFLGLLLAMCIQLARDFSRTHFEKIAQEVDNARKAQALEEAKKLEHAHRELAVKHRQLQETQSQLVQSEKMASLGRLVAGVAHELNSPIGAMNSAHDSLGKAKMKLEALIAEKANEDLKTDRKLITSFKVMDDSAKVFEQGSARVVGMVERLKSFARLDEAELLRADIHRGIEDTLAMASHELGDRIEVVRDFGADLPEILCKPGQLNQVLLNVLINAKHAIADRGRIEIRTRAIDGRITIAVKDDGTGIPAAVLARVFEPGFTTKGNRVGMGLGLSIAYRVVQDHGGEISIASEEGKGTEVTISLPIDRPSAHSEG